MAGCGEPPRNDNPFGSGTDSGAATLPSSATGSVGEGSQSATSTAASGPDTSDETSEAEPIFDVGSVGDVPSVGCDPETEDCGCNAVDILFVVDNSGSMTTHRDAITAAFPTFVDEMVNALPEGTDLHVGLTRSETALAAGRTLGLQRILATERDALDAFVPAALNNTMRGVGRSIAAMGVRRTLHKYANATPADP